MVEDVSFQTRARTVDHLGREQIADCPTAISELWKNAYDAYSRNVALNIFDGDIPVAALVDDGHGMSREEFSERWLVLGTNTKASGDEVPIEDRDGLPYRVPQGQKGIGRLSSAYLGPLLLVASKRIGMPFVAALIDWRLFENPFLLLQDIKIPVIEANSKNDLVKLLPNMFDRLMGNIWGDQSDTSRNERLKLAWDSFDKLEKNEEKEITREKIEKTIIETAFCERHFQSWSVWSEKSKKGTALFIGDIIFDLSSLLSNNPSEDSQIQSRDKMFKTLSCFVDPYSDYGEDSIEKDVDVFKYSVTAWNGNYERNFISKEREFGLSELENLEHVLDGHVDTNGIFRGRVKSFGQWLPGEVEIIPEGDLPKRSDTKVGPFEVRIGSYEYEERNTTLSKEILAMVKEQAEKYSGLMLFRDGLRIMPYGREDNDFFEIEARRSKHAGREFWQARRMFGRIALSRIENSNLRDKAGREGLIVNRAANVFRDLVINILMVAARRYYGTDSDIRDNTLPAIQLKYKEQKALEEQKKLKKKKLKDFRTNLRKNAPELSEILSDLIDLSNNFDQIQSDLSEDMLLNIREKVIKLIEALTPLALGPAPAKLGSLEEEYREYRNLQKQIQTHYSELKIKIDQSLEKLNPKEPRQIAYSELSRHAAFLHNRIKLWVKKASSILESEQLRIKDLADSRNKLFHSRMLPILDDVENERMSLNHAFDELAKEKERQDFENSELFEPYIFALESLKESIDIAGIASFSEDQISELREEVERLNSLAQLGITVEILGHELETLDTTISRNLNEMPNEIKNTTAFQTLLHAHEDLMNRLRFLSPLKLSGDKTRKWISGKDIQNYIIEFFGDVLAKNNVSLESSPSFQQFRVYEQPARLYPVFLNLVNNARYWVCRSEKSERKILLDAYNEQVLVADDGPGVEEDDFKYLFSLFFTRKIRGGRGVGLYLCRANLASGGHTIQYITNPDEKSLPGANFVITFKGAEYV